VDVATLSAIDYGEMFLCTYLYLNCGKKKKRKRERLVREDIVDIVTESQF
jgi:hypothetical protein